MFSSLTSYLWGSSTETDGTQNEQSTNDATAQQPRPRTTSPMSKRDAKPEPTSDNDWVVVDTPSRESSRDRMLRLDLSTVECTDSVNLSSGREHVVEKLSSERECVNCDVLPNNNSPSHSKSSNFSVTNNRDVMHSSVSDTGSEASHVSTLPDMACSGESWLVTPPPCFTAGGTSPHMQTGPLEDLLIEHPSMSVYGPRGRQGSEGVDSEHDSETSGDEMDMVPPVFPAPTERQRQRQVTPRHPPRRPHAVAARAGIAAQNVRARNSAQVNEQRYYTRSSTRSALRRQNKAVLMKQNMKHLSPRVICQPSRAGANKSRF